MLRTAHCNLRSRNLIKWHYDVFVVYFMQSLQTLAKTLVTGENSSPTQTRQRPLAEWRASAWKCLYTCCGVRWIRKKLTENGKFKVTEANLEKCQQQMVLRQTRWCAERKRWVRRRERENSGKRNSSRNHKCIYARVMANERYIYCATPTRILLRRSRSRTTVFLGGFFTLKIPLPVAVVCSLRNKFNFPR